MTLPILLPIALAFAAPHDLAATSANDPPAPVAAERPVVATPPAQRSAGNVADGTPDAVAPARVIPARHHHAPGDPLEGFNRKMFGVNHALDKAIYRPAAMGYQHAVPKQVRSGLRNFFGNLGEPAIFVNYLLQFRVGKALRTLGRFTINSTVGVGGLIDVAKTRGIRLPHQRNSFGDTLAWYGVGPGPYLFLPLVGPSTLRDLLGGPFDDAIVPALILSKLAGPPFNGWPFLVTSAVIPGLDIRAESDADLRALTDGAIDPYASLRSAWLQNRAAEVAEQHRPHGQPQATPELGDPLLDPATDPAAHPPEAPPQPPPPPPPPDSQSAPADPAPNPEHSGL